MLVPQMIHCQACCDPFHHFCAHLPKALVLRLTAWYCHRCAICSLCGGKEADGKSFVADVIETCYRCHKQFHIHCNSSSNFMLFNRNSEREITVGFFLSHGQIYCSIHFFVAVQLLFLTFILSNLPSSSKRIGLLSRFFGCFIGSLYCVSERRGTRYVPLLLLYEAFARFFE